METLNLTKGQTIDLKKADGTAISKIRVGLSWDVKSGVTADLDLFVVAKETKKVAYFNDKTAIKGITLGEDNLTGEGEGDDETVEMDATQSEDGTYVVCVNIFNATTTFANVANAKATVYDAQSNEVLATYSVSESGGDHTALIVGEVKDSGDNYTFTAKGDYLNGDIAQVAASL
jgi:stress response protein SCP2